MTVGDGVKRSGDAEVLTVGIDVNPGQITVVVADGDLAPGVDVAGLEADAGEAEGAILLDSAADFEEEEVIGGRVIGEKAHGSGAF